MKRQIIDVLGAVRVALLWTMVLGTLIAVTACEDEPPPMQRGGEPTPQKVEPTEAEKAQNAANQEPTGQPQKKAEATQNPAAAPKKDAEEKVIPPAKRPQTLPAVTPEACGFPQGVNVHQVLDYGVKQDTDKVRVEIVRPQPLSILKTGRVRIEVRLLGFRTKKEPGGGGRHLRVLLDNERARNWFDANERSMSIDGLAPGLHSIRVMAVDRSGLVIKSAKAFDALSFYVRSNEDQPTPVDFSKPLLSYSSPSGTYMGKDADQVPLDFHIANGRLGVDGHRVRMVLDGNPPVDFKMWSPTFLSGLPDGDHTVVLSLLDKNGVAVPGPFNNKIEGQFTIQRQAKP